MAQKRGIVTSYGLEPVEGLLKGDWQMTPEAPIRARQHSSKCEWLALESPAG